MRLKNKADIRTLLWTMVLTPGVVVAQWLRPDWIPFLAPLSAYFALACGIVAHNHNHCPTFVNKRTNQLFGAWISVFYGYPTFAWIPTHNLNHHKFVNKAGDATITWRHSNRHSLWVAATYFFVSAYQQGKPIRDFIASARARKPALYRRIVFQYSFWAGAHALGLGAGILRHGLASGVYFYVCAMLVPAFFALFTIMLFNYEQHVHCDAYSKDNHSRNFVSPVMNFLLFNNGLHTIHHENPGSHWSRAKELHAQREAAIHPALKQPGLLIYWFKQYALAPFWPKLGTQQIGQVPWKEPHTGKNVRVHTADVAAVEIGTNAPMAA